MNQQGLDYLRQQRVCVLTTLLADEMPHAAALHYSHLESPLELFFGTTRGSRKMSGLTEHPSKAAVVIGFDEREMVTLQMEGQVRIVSDKVLLKKFQGAHFVKHPEAAQYQHESETVYLAFTPTWWRYTDFKTDPITIFVSEPIKGS